MTGEVTTICALAPAGESERQAALVLARELVHAGILAEPLEQLGRRHVGHEHEDEVAHDLAPPPHLAGDDRAAHAGQLLQRGAQALRLFGGVVGQPEGAGLPQVGDALEDVLRGLLAEARQLGEPAVVRGRLELGQGIDAEHVVDLPNLGDAEAGDGEHLDQARRDLLPQLLEHAGPAGGDQLGDDLERGRTHALGRGERAVLDGLSQIAGKLRHGAGRGAERADAKRVLAAELEEGGDLLEHIGHGLAVGELLQRVHCTAPAMVRQPSSSSSSPPVSE